jgi:hypothetical protein
MSIVSLRQELEEARTQTIESLHQQVEAGNNAARDSQALLRVNQEQQQQLRTLPPSNYQSGSGGVISGTPFVLPFLTPSTGIRTRELHSPGYYHVDAGYRGCGPAERMCSQIVPSSREIPPSSVYLSLVPARSRSLQS